MVFSALASLLNLAPLPLIKLSVTAINDAAPLALSRQEGVATRRKETEESLKRASRALGISDEQAVRVADQAFETVDEERQRPLVREVAKALDRSPAVVERALGSGGNRPSGSLDPLRMLAFYCALVMASFGLKYFCVRNASILLSEAAARLANRSSATPLRQAPAAADLVFRRKRAGAIQSVLTNDVGVYSGAIGVLKDSIEAPLTILGALLFVVSQAPFVAFVGVLFVIPMSSVIRRNGSRIKASQEGVQNTLSDVSAVTSENLQGVRVVKAFAAEAKIEGDYKTRIDAAFESQMRNARVSASLRPLVNSSARPPLRR